MKKILFILILAVTAASFADEAKSKEEMKANLDKFVKENQEASTSIAPLIAKVREILSEKKVKPEAAPKK